MEDNVVAEIFASLALSGPHRCSKRCGGATGSRRKSLLEVLCSLDEDGSTPRYLRLILSHLDRLDADSLRRTCRSLKKLVDENYAHFRMPAVRSILLDGGRSTAEVLAIVRLESDGQRVTRKFAGTCAQLEAKFLEFLCFSTVTDGISLRYLSDSRDGTARDLYNLVRTLSSVVNLRGKYELRRVAVDAVHVDHWRAMFPGMKEMLPETGFFCLKHDLARVCGTEYGTEYGTARERLSAGRRASSVPSGDSMVRTVLYERYKA
ncbi:hypothetical protein AAVH_13580 [Aphelenchoides avenae]|nr:hypothetical protein AAVH_13580 [Aphelenchus avenae]